MKLDWLTEILGLKPHFPGGHIVIVHQQSQSHHRRDKPWRSCKIQDTSMLLLKLIFLGITLLW